MPKYKEETDEKQKWHQQMLPKWVCHVIQNIIPSTVIFFVMLRF
jgi:hypothetical protein